MAEPLDDKVKLALLIILASADKDLEKATNMFGVVVQSFFKTEEQKIKLNDEAGRLTEVLVNKMTEEKVSRISIILTTLNLASTMIKMVADDIKGEKLT
jgi:hypothetical protein